MSKMTKIVTILLIVFYGVVILCGVYWYMFFRQFRATEKFIESFDRQYMYTRLNSPKKTIYTVVILENRVSGKDITYTLPFFNDRTIRTINWGLTTNDLFVLSSDTGLTVYRRIDDIWTPLFLQFENSSDGSPKYYLCDYVGSKIIKHSEIPSDTIPDDIKNRTSKYTN